MKVSEAANLINGLRVGQQIEIDTNDLETERLLTPGIDDELNELVLRRDGLISWVNPENMRMVFALRENENNEGRR